MRPLFFLHIPIENYRKHRVARITGIKIATLKKKKKKFLLLQSHPSRVAV